MWKQPSKNYKDQGVFPTVNLAGGGLWSWSGAAGTRKLQFIEGAMYAKNTMTYWSRAHSPLLKNWPEVQYINMITTQTLAASSHCHGGGEDLTLSPIGLFSLNCTHISWQHIRHSLLCGVFFFFSMEQEKEKLFFRSSKCITFHCSLVSYLQCCQIKC